MLERSKASNIGALQADRNNVDRSNWSAVLLDMLRVTSPAVDDAGGAVLLDDVHAPPRHSRDAADPRPSRPRQRQADRGGDHGQVRTRRAVQNVTADLLAATPAQDLAALRGTQLHAGRKGSISACGTHYVYAESFCDENVADFYRASTTAVELGFKNLDFRFIKTYKSELTQRVQNESAEKLSRW